MTKELSVIEQVKSYEPLKVLFDKDTIGYEKYIASILNVIKAKPALQKCSAQSILTSIHNAKTLGLEIDARQFCHLIPYATECKLEVDFRGFLYKMGQVLKDFNYKVCFVHAEDEFEVWSDNDNDFYSHKIKKAFAKAEDAVGLYFHFTYTVNSQKCSRIERASIDEVLKAKKAAKSQNVWNEWFGEMGKKFIIRRACKGRFNQDPEIANLIKFDDQNYDSIKDVTPAKAVIDSAKLPEAKAIFEEDAVEGEAVTVEPNITQSSSGFDLYSKIRNDLMDAQTKEEVEKVAEFYKQQFANLTKEQQQDLSGVKKSRLELFAKPDLK